MTDLEIATANQQIDSFAALPFKLLHGVVNFVELAMAAALNGDLQIDQVKCA